MVIGGDFNARTGREGGGYGGGEEEGEESRVESSRSKDSEVNGEGRRLCRFLEERGWGF